MNWTYYFPKFNYEEAFSDLSTPWSGHRYFGYDLVRNTKPKIIVELGTHKGTSFFTFCQAFKDIDDKNALAIAVDSWQGDIHSGYYGEEIFREFTKNIQQYYSNVNTEIIRDYFDNVIERFENESIDLLHIDGLHTYESSKHDFECWLPKMKKDGIILFHDIMVKRDNFGVYQLWEELSGKYKVIEFRHSYGLGVLLLDSNAWLYKNKRDLELHYAYALEDIENARILDLEKDSAVNQSVQKENIKESLLQKQQITELKEYIKEKEMEKETLNTLLSRQKQELEIMKQTKIWRTRSMIIKLKGILKRILHNPSLIIPYSKKLIQKGLGRMSIVEGNLANAPNKEQDEGIMDLRNIFESRFPYIRGIEWINLGSTESRLNLVTDSISKESLFGGVATSLILATLYCNKYKIPLRIITRNKEASPQEFIDFLDIYKLDKPKSVSFFNDVPERSFQNNYKLEVSKQDIFLATSWWSAKTIKTINQRSNFFYLLQEVEAFFYPHGDDMLIVENLLKENGIKYILNTKLLYDYFCFNNYKEVKESSCYFEPAFPCHMFYPNETQFLPKCRRKLFFYGRPNNHRNLFYNGLRYLDESILNGTINLDHWDIYIAGSSIPDFIFSNGYQPKILGHINWNEYLTFIKDVDLTFSLMYTPHPSYPPLDIAASGGVVLTNKCLNKQSLDYSQNIILADLDSTSMSLGFQKAISLVENVNLRKNNFENNKIERDWKITMEHVLEFMNIN